MRVKRRDEHTVTDDRCISLFSFPSPRRPAVRRGNEVRPPACHLGGGGDGCWEKGEEDGREVIRVAVGWGWMAATRRGRAHQLHPPSRILHDNKGCCHSLLPPSLIFFSFARIYVCINSTCIYVCVCDDEGARTRAHREG